MKPSYSFLAFAGSAVLVGLALAGSPRERVAAAATPPPSPPPIGGTAQTPPPDPALPTPSASFAPSGYGSPNPHATATPSPPADVRKGLDGVWEVAIQHPNGTVYTHFAIQQQGTALSGTYLDAANKKYPIVGNLDGQDVRLIVSLPNGTTVLLEGKLDGNTDMIGILTMAGGDVPFTASYRAKTKWIENVNASPGGVGGQGGGSYTPP